MNLLTITLLTLCLAPQVEVNTFQGEPRTGEWRGLSDDRMTLAVSGQETSIPLSEVLEVRFRGEAAKLNKPAAVVTLWDGTTLSCSRLQVNEQKLTLASPLLGDLTLPKSDVA